MEKLMIAIDRSELTQNLANVEAVLLKIESQRTGHRGPTKDEEFLYNTVEFAVIFNGDLTTCLYSVERTLGDWDSRFHARVLALLLLESSKKFKTLLGKDMRAIVRRYGSEKHSEDLTELHSTIVQRSKRFELSLGGLRDNAIAHRDRSAARQLQEIRALDLDSLATEGWEMIRWLNGTYALVTSISEFSRSRTA
jgi:hypothetical protein